VGSEKNGRVTLEGAVDWQFQKALAESAVKKLKGAIGVTNNITVKPQLEPTDVKRKIEGALRRSADLDARRITVEVDGSAIRLYGSVRAGTSAKKPNVRHGRRPALPKSRITSPSTRSVAAPGAVSPLAGGARSCFFALKPLP
jgi:hypothetical protein